MEGTRHIGQGQAAGILIPVTHIQIALVYVTLVGCAAAGIHSTALLLPRKQPGGNCCSSRSSGAEKAVGSSSPLANPHHTLLPGHHTEN